MTPGFPVFDSCHQCSCLTLLWALVTGGQTVLVRNKQTNLEDTMLDTSRSDQLGGLFRGDKGHGEDGQGLETGWI